MCYQLGVLLVHGIGDQARGNTLLSFGDPLIETARAWLAGRGLGKVEVVKAELSEMRDDAEIPAQAELRFEVQNEAGEKQTFSWLLVENWWAKEFHKPAFGDLASWIFRIGPWAIISHSMRPFLFRTRLRPWHFVQVLLALPFCWLAQITVLLLSLLAWLPIPPLRRGVSNLLLHLTGTLGDSYVLLNSPAQRAAARDKLQRRLKWISSQCDSVAVIAHSQGAAIAHEALVDCGVSNVKKLITFGSGLAKLKELEPVNEGAHAPIRWIIFWTSLLLLLLGPTALEIAPFGEGERSLILSIFFFTPAAFLLVIFIVVFEELKRTIKESSKLSLEPLSWSDYYAESDPVPNGPIVESEPWLNSQAVTNHANYFRDHNRYWENRDDFVRSVLSELSLASGAVLFNGDSQAIRRKRQKRVWLLIFLRALLVVSIGIAIWAFRDSANGFGRSLLDGPLASNTLAEPIAQIAKAIGAVIGAILSYFAKTSWLPSGLQAVNERAFWVVGMSIPVLVILAWHHFGTFALWKSFDHQHFRWLCAPRTEPSHPVDRLWRPICTCLVGLIPLAFAVGAIYHPNPGELLFLAIYTLIYWLLLAASVSMVVVLFAKIWLALLKLIGWIWKRITSQRVDASQVPVTAVNDEQKAKKN